jgi:hypothetical protein
MTINPNIQVGVFYIFIIMKKLYLDDIRTPIDENWDVVRSYNEFVSKINEVGLDYYDIISLDHDLGDVFGEHEEKNGYNCAYFLVYKSIDDKIDLPQVYTHSDNITGVTNIIKLINNYYKVSKSDYKCFKVKIPFTV